MNTRERIIEAARIAFTEYGYEKTSMADIGERVGMNKASLYYHFKDKRSLFAEMVAENRGKHVVGRNAALEGAEPGKGRILAFVRAELGFVAALSLNFFEPARKGPESDETGPVFSTIIAEDLLELSELILECPGYDPSRISPEELAASILKVVQGLLLVDCPFDYPRAEREAVYNRIADQADGIISLMLRGAGA